MKISILKLTALAIWLAPGINALAQSPTPEQEKDGTSYLRCFGELGERLGKVTYSLTYTKPKAKAGDPPGQLFAGVNGGYCSVIGTRAVSVPSGRYTFVLSVDGSGTKETLSAVLEPDALYSLLATVEGTRPKLRLVREYPLADKEAPGLVVHNILTNVPLVFKIGDGTPLTIPYSADRAFFLPATQITGPLSAEFPSVRGTPRTRTLEYSTGTKQIAVFYRNGFGQRTLSVFPAKPDKSEEQPQ